jgi:hypothetical protein
MNESTLSEFVEAAGASLSEAQGELAGEELASTSMAVAEAELDAKVAIRSGSDGVVRVQPVSLADVTGGALDAAGLSNVRVHYVAVAESRAAEAGIQPKRSKSDVLEEVIGAEDLGRLDAILGGLVFEASYVPALDSWLVVASDQLDNVVREIVVDDVKR